MTDIANNAAPTFTKAELTAALTNAQVAIPRKANLATLTELYEKHIVARDEVEAPATDLVPVADDFTPMSDEELEAQRVAGMRSTPDPRDGDCPGCGIHLSNGLLTPDDEVANKPGVTLHMEGMVNEFHCMGCGHEWGSVRDAYVPAAPTATGTGLRIEKDRPEQNGVKRPSVGGKCRAIWDALDEYRAETGELPTSKTVKALAADSGWNPNNASIEYYQWRKFNGIAKG